MSGERENCGQLKGSCVRFNSLQKQICFGGFKGAPYLEREEFNIRNQYVKQRNTKEDPKKMIEEQEKAENKTEKSQN